MESKKAIRIFNDATAIVTGGASGIGKALAEELARRGCEVVLADLQIEKAQDVAAQIQTSGGRAKALKVDVTDSAAWPTITALKTGIKLSISISAALSMESRRHTLS